MPGFETVYTDDQRDAIATATLDRGIKPAAKVSELAAAGELVFKGEQLAPFKVPVGTVRSLARYERKRRAGDVRSALAEQPPRDATEALRKRLVSWADTELQRMERAQRRGIEGDIERFRHVIRAVREIAALPAHDAPPTAKPGQGPKADRLGAMTKTGPVAAILQAHRATSGQAAPEAPTTESGQQSIVPTGAFKEKDATEGAQREDEPPTHADDNEPGVFVAERIELLQA